MANVQYEPSGTDVSKFESDIAQTINLSGSVIELIREPIALLYESINKGRQLKQSLGLWQDEALDDGGQYRIPLIHNEQFEQHLVNTDGIIPAASQDSVQAKTPQRWSFRSFFNSGPKQAPGPSPDLPRVFPSSGTACWGYLLYALGVSPGKGIVDWRPSTDGLVGTQNGGIEMEMDGPVLCHILNLYSRPLFYRVLLSQSRYDEKVDHRLGKQYSLVFGKLAWDVINGQVHAHFTPGAERTLTSETQPFGPWATGASAGMVMASYFTALLYGVSDPKFYLASPKAPLLKRVERLIDCVTNLTKKRKTTIFISSDWFQEASRVKRRVVTQGGDDLSFFDDVVEILQSDAELTQLRGGRLKEDIREVFLLDSHEFAPWIRGDSIPSGLAGEPSTAWLACERVLSGYADQPAGSWKRNLFDTRKMVLKVLGLSNRIYLSSEMKLQYVEFTRTCDIWQKTIFLGAPELS